MIKKILGAEGAENFFGSVFWHFDGFSMIFGVRYGEGWGEGGPHRRKKFKRRSQLSKKISTLCSTVSATMISVFYVGPFTEMVSHICSFRKIFMVDTTFCV